MADLFDTLRRPVDDETTMPPPELIRKRGDRLSRRRHVWQAVAAACAAGVAVTGGFWVTDAIGGEEATSGPATQVPPVQEPPAQQPPGSEETIPDGFPLDLGIEELGSEGKLSGPAGDVHPLVDLPICGRRGYSGPETASDELGLVAAMPQLIRTRYLTAHPDAETATAAARHLVETFESCPTVVSPVGDTTTTSVEPGSLGERSWVVIQTFETAELGPMLGQEVVQVVLADEAVLVSWTSSEGPGALDAAALERSVTEDTEALEPVVGEVCALVEADCG